MEPTPSPPSSLSTADLISAVEWIALVIGALIAGTVILVKFISKMLGLLLQSYQDRIAGILAERDHFKARMEAHDDEIRRLAAELIEALRRQERDR